MVEGPEPVAAALDLLHAEVQALGGAVGGAGDAVGEDLGAPPLQRVAERGDLGDVGLCAAGDGLVQQDPGIGPPFREVVRQS